VDKFSYFIIFYSLILGLALTELLGGFARMVRARALRKLEAQTALAGLMILLYLCATWLDAWDSLRTVTLDFAGLAAPVLLAICYYLAAAVVFPHQEADHERLASYYEERRPFIMTMMLAASLLENTTYSGIFAASIDRDPPLFWLWLLPYNLAIDGSMLALIFLRSRRANVVLLCALILLITIPYWSNNMIGPAIVHLAGYR
jgi:uncharacterized membrane protein